MDTKYRCSLKATKVSTTFWVWKHNDILRNIICGFVGTSGGKIFLRSITLCSEGGRLRVVWLVCCCSVLRFYFSFLDVRDVFGIRCSLTLDPYAWLLRMNFHGYHSSLAANLCAEVNIMTALCPVHHPFFLICSQALPEIKHSTIISARIKWNKRQIKKILKSLEEGKFTTVSYKSIYITFCARQVLCLKNNLIRV